MSLLYYVLIAETLGNAICVDPKITGIRPPGCQEEIKVIQFADDTTQLTTSVESMNAFFTLLEDYSKASGANIKPAKTQGITLNHPEDNLPVLDMPVK